MQLSASNGGLQNVFDRNPISNIILSAQLPEKTTIKSRDKVLFNMYTTFYT